MARRKESHGGGHGWFVTFADLMGLLVSFFVMLVAFSNQNSQKVQAVAGSMRDAFGVQKDARYSGILESGGLPTRDVIKNAAHIQPEDSSITPTPDQGGQSDRSGEDQKSHSDHTADRAFALAAASLRNALHDMPELTEASKHIMIEETHEGLNIDIVDQNGHSMFPEGSKEPYKSTRLLLQRIVGPLRAIPYRISITGHSAGPESSAGPNSGPWFLSIGRANAVRQIFAEEGYPADRFYKIAGKGDTDPLFPEAPGVAPNRRVTITLIREAPAVPPDLLP